MALNPSQISRRNFVQRAGLLVSALGVGASVQAGLMDAIVKKATRKWGAEALAAEPLAVKFHVELNFRAGLQMNSLFPSDGHKMDARNPALNIYSSATNILPVALPTQNGAAKPLYIAKYGAGVGGDALATYLGANAGMKYGVATSEAVKLTSGAHTAQFNTRSPGGISVPAVVHAALGPATPVSGIEWNDGIDVDNTRGNLSSLAGVNSATTMQALFKDLPMYFSKGELALIAGEFNASTGALNKSGAVDDFDKLFAAKNVPGSSNIASVSVAGRNQAQLSLLAAIQAKFDLIKTNFVGINDEVGAGGPMGLALANAAAAMGAGVMTTFTMALDSNDWHGDQPAMDSLTGKQGLWNKVIGNALTGFLKSLDQLQSPFDNAVKMSDSFLISLGSEFTRTPNRLGNNNDNGDGGNQAFAFIGSKVRSGSFGNITGAGNVVPFDPATGALATAAITEPMIWKTHGQLLGISDTTLNGMLPGVSSCKGAMVR